MTRSVLTAVCHLPRRRNSHSLRPLSFSGHRSLIMATDTAKVAAKLAALTASFDDLEALLEPLFADPLPETLLALEPLQQAKLQTLLPYILYDLIFSASSPPPRPAAAR